MRRSAIFAATCLVSLAACGSDPASDAESGGVVTSEEMAERVAAADIKPQAGQYRSTVEVLEFTLPGAPKEVNEVMRSNMAKRTSEYCLTQEEADRGFEKMARQSQQGSDCTVEKFDVAGGDIEARMTCAVPGQGKMTMTMSGTGSATGSDMEMTMKGDFAGQGEATIRMKVSNERIGDCG
ncbi:MAG: DUF3617 domain-containing protein [Erythrobacter sp.]